MLIAPDDPARADVYAMEFSNEIALTGELSEIGLPVRRNVGRSHRRGLSAFVIGLLHGLAEMFAVTAEVAHEQSRDAGADHDVFLITWKEAAAA